MTWKEGKDMIERELEKKKEEERGWKEMKDNFTSTLHMPQLYWLNVTICLLHSP